MAKILLVEDDLELAEQLGEWFSLENQTVEIVNTGEDALQLLSAFSYDVIVLDWGLPRMTGIEVCKAYRASGGKTPILFLTGKGDVDSRVTGLDVGADDYLVKPFDTRELSARVRSLARRPQDISLLAYGDMKLDAAVRTLQVGERSIQLLPKETALLEYLIKHPKRHFSARALLDAVWPSESAVSEDTVRTTVKTLRRQLNTIGKGDCLKTQLGSGYYLE